MPALPISKNQHFEQEYNAKNHGFSHNDVERQDLIIKYLAYERREVRGSDGAVKAADTISRLLTQ